MTNNTSDPVKNPAHYTFGRFEVKEVIQDWGIGFSLGNAVKYIARAGRKDPSKTVEDLRKAVFYLNDEIAALEAQQATDAFNKAAQHEANRQLGIVSYPDMLFVAKRTTTLIAEGVGTTASEEHKSQFGDKND